MNFVLIPFIFIFISCTHVQKSENRNLYSGPLVDAMAQWNNDEGEDLESLLKISREAGVKRVAIFARRPNQSKIDNSTMAIPIAEKYPDQVILGSPKCYRLEKAFKKNFDIKIRKCHLDGQRLERYRFFSELMLRHSDKDSGISVERGERVVSPLNDFVLELISRLQIYQIPIMLHWELYDFSQDQPAFSELFRKFPQQIFIIPHMGFGSPQQIEFLLKNHPNVYVTISKKLRPVDFFQDKIRESGLGESILDESGLVRLSWRAILEKYHGRILFATDAHKVELWMKYPELVQDGRILLGQLPDDMAADIAYANAERIYANKK